MFLPPGGEEPFTGVEDPSGSTMAVTETESPDCPSGSLILKEKPVAERCPRFRGSNREKGLAKEISENKFALMVPPVDSGEDLLLRWDPFLFLEEETFINGFKT